jgi:hypothetical protein
MDCSIIICLQMISKHSPLDGIPRIMSTLNFCAVDVCGWCSSRRLQLTELFLFGTASNFHKFPPSSSAMYFGSSIIESVDVVRNLRVMIDAQLSMHEHVSRTA